MSRSFHVLVNPASGGGRALARVAPVAAALRAAGAAVEVVESEGLAHSVAEAAAASAEGKVVVACGGDGMLASVAGAVVAADGTLGIIPSGRGNDFARQLGLLADDTDVVVRTLLEAEPRRVDVIRVGDRVVLGSVYAGVDSLSSELVDRAHWMPQKLQYPYAAVRALLTYPGNSYRLTVDGEVRDFEGFSVVVANSGYYGKGMHVAPTAVVDDGWLDVVVLPRASRLTLVRLMPQVYDGSHLENPSVVTFRAREVRIEASDPVRVGGDGELIEDLPVTVRVDPGALAVLAP